MLCKEHQPPEQWFTHYGDGRECTAEEELQLLAALARSPAALKLTGKGQLHWRRLENAAWRATAVSRRFSKGRPVCPGASNGHHHEDESLMGRARLSLQSTRRRAIVSCQCRANAARLHKWHTVAPRSDRPTKAALLQMGPPAERSLERRSSGASSLDLEALALRKRPIYPPLGTLELPRGHPLVLAPDDVLAAPDDPAFLRAREDEFAALPPLVNQDALLSASQLTALGFSCGGLAGSVSRAVVHPLDTLRVLQSVSSKVVSAEVRATPAAAAAKCWQAQGGHAPLRAARRAHAAPRRAHTPHRLHRVAHRPVAAPKCHQVVASADSSTFERLAASTSHWWQVPSPDEPPEPALPRVGGRPSPTRAQTESNLNRGAEANPDRSADPSEPLAADGHARGDRRPAHPAHRDVQLAPAGRRVGQPVLRHAAGAPGVCVCA